MQQQLNGRRGLGARGAPGRRAPRCLASASPLPSSAVQTATQPSAALASTLRLRGAACYLPHPEKVSYGGEDAHFISDVRGGALGVADGVGGWKEEGINPAEYSRSLMRVACSHLEAQQTIDPRGAIDVAHKKTRCAGSSTACIVQIDAENRKIVAANLGDSGFVVVRDGKVIARSRALQHHFDCPLQLGAYPDFVEITDTAEQADMYNIDVQPGDVIVAGSDGLWDNAYDHELIAAVGDAADVQASATRLASLARANASDPQYKSPYTREALENGYDLPWWEKVATGKFQNGKFQLGQLSGGKQDDITVIVAAVVSQPAPQGEAVLQ